MPQADRAVPPGPSPHLRPVLGQAAHVGPATTVARGPSERPPAPSFDLLAGAPAPPRRPRPLFVLVALASLAVGAASLATASPFQLALVLTSTVLGAASALLGLLAAIRASRRRAGLAALAAFVEHDGSPCYVTDALGEVTARNRAAGGAEPGGATLAAVLGGQFASPGAMLFRLQAQAQARAGGAAREDTVTRRGHLRLSVHHVDDDAFLWRVEDLGDRNGAGRAADSLSLPMLTAGPAGTILYMNEAFRKLTGGRQRHVDRVFLDLPVVSGRLHRVEGASGPVDCLVAQVAGPGGRSEIYLLPNEAGAQGLATGWEAVEDLPVPLVKVSRRGEVLATNHHARALLPMPVGVGTRFSDLIEGLGRPVIEWLTDVAEGRPTQGPQVVRATEPHGETFLRVSLSLAGPPHDLYLVAVLQDVTEHRALEEQVVQSQKMQAIGQLAGGVAHDFNNLLTAISGHCDLLLLRHDQGDPDYPDLMQISQNSNRAAALVGQLLAFSRKQNLQPETLDPRDALADLTHLLNRLVGEKVRLSLQHDPNLQAIRADKRQLEQVIVNLVVNARDAMPEGGEVRIETANHRLREPLVRDRATVPPGDYVVIRVADEGTGILPERLPKIFEPFYTTKRPGEGTGLGLSTAYGIVKQTGGFIFVDSIVDEGTVFSLWLPAHDRPVPAPAPAPVAPPTPRKAEGVVLLVEDEAPVRAFASRALRLRGYTVLEADSAEAALRLLADPALAVDLFVTDVIMPGKDGPTWVREALADRPDTKVVFVSGYAEEAFAEQQALIPNSTFLPKPFSLAELTALVDKQLR